MTSLLRYDPSAAYKLLNDSDITELQHHLLAARDEVIADVQLLDSGEEIPSSKQPLDAGFIELPAELLKDAEQNGAESLLERIQQTADELRGELDRVVSLGIGGSYMGARSLFEALCDPFHNELSRDARGNVPRMYFEGNNVDNDATCALLDMLKSQCCEESAVSDRWGVVVISKSGGTLETAVAFRLFRQALEDYYGADSEESRRFVVPVTGEQGKLRDLSTAKGYPAVFPIPDNVGGRFSIFTAVGLLPAAILGLDVTKLLQGAADMTENFRTADFGSNPVLDYTACCHLFERDHQATMRILSTWGKSMEAVGLWYDQLLSESLGKEEQGATPITVVNTRDLHSRGQQHQEGIRNKLITNVIVESAKKSSLAVPEYGDNHDQLNKFTNKSLPDILSAAIEGTNKAYADESRPTADLVLPSLDEYHLGQLFQMLMLATVVEGRLIGINPYGQPGVEAYKTNMTAILNR